ncbi:hypothetical protein MPDQ_003951 [Monascus purpureus]|uniref:DUF895 domain membrane protein n=1 Tax=Monascus purpureus TaxID=5098 RepID=A0A507R1T7_MONPU|nr:hypothetical protein MPDQ_003951 [Monascus purpureus]
MESLKIKAGGEESASLSNVVNAVTFGALTGGGFVTGIICNTIGPQWVLVLGTLGYAPYSAGLYANAAFGNKWLPILGGLTCGISGIFLWTATGAINLVYPPVDQRGRAVAAKFTLQNLGGSLGGIISLGLNAKMNHSGRVSDSTYYAFISIMCLGLPAALAVPRPDKVIRGDGSRTRLEYYMWTWNAAYHSVRARALLSILFYLIGPTLIGPIQGYLLDNPKWRRQSRARYGVVSFTVIALLTWIYGLVVQYQYDKRSPTAPAIDIVDPVFAKSCLLFIVYGLIENSAMIIGYWIIGSLGLDPGDVAALVGLATGIGSGGSTAAFILGACNVPLIRQLWANVIAFLVGVPGLLYVGFFHIADDSTIDAITTAHLNSDDEKETPDPEKGAPVLVRVPSS